MRKNVLALSIAAMVGGFAGVAQAGVINGAAALATGAVIGGVATNSVGGAAVGAVVGGAAGALKKRRALPDALRQGPELLSDPVARRCGQPQPTSSRPEKK